MFKLKSKLRITLICITAFILIIVVLDISKKLRFKTMMENYLKREYGKEFVVTKLHYYWQELGGSTVIGGIAYPKDDPDLKFDIGTAANENIPPERRTFGETYIRDYWEKQKDKELKAILNNDLVSAMILATYKRSELNGKTIDIDKAEQLFKDRIDLSIRYGTFVSLEDYNQRLDEFINLATGNLSTNQAENLFNIIKKLQNPNYKEIDLEITYFNKEHEKKVKKAPKDHLFGRVSEFVEFEPNDRGIVLCRFLINDLNSINKPEDISNLIYSRASYLHQYSLINNENETEN
ncbi:MAG TPA: hypothetical protein PLZ08_00065 [Bacillota bacterium]|jgi:hypothetical protein|nr:hypothetical protein [Bacillota bacterium]HOL08761.1 hypothetical protein [Bacillota bacterium]HPO96336.1 hypothetical protein [Bacillota bacterium]